MKQLIFLAIFAVSQSTVAMVHRCEDQENKSSCEKMDHNYVGPDGCSWEQNSASNPSAIGCVNAYPCINHFSDQACLRIKKFNDQKHHGPGCGWSYSEKKCSDLGTEVNAFSCSFVGPDKVASTASIPPHYSFSGYIYKCTIEGAPKNALTDLENTKTICRSSLGGNLMDSTNLPKSNGQVVRVDTKVLKDNGCVTKGDFSSKSLGVEPPFKNTHTNAKVGDQCFVKVNPNKTSDRSSAPAVYVKQYCSEGVVQETKGKLGDTRVACIKDGIVISDLKNFGSFVTYDWFTTKESCDQSKRIDFRPM